MAAEKHDKSRLARFRQPRLGIGVRAALAALLREEQGLSWHEAREAVLDIADDFIADEMVHLNADPPPVGGGFVDWWTAFLESDIGKLLMALLLSFLGFTAVTKPAETPAPAPAV